MSISLFGNTSAGVLASILCIVGTSVSSAVFNSFVELEVKYLDTCPRLH